MNRSRDFRAKERTCQQQNKTLPSEGQNPDQLEDPCEICSCHQSTVQEARYVYHPTRHFSTRHERCQQSTGASGMFYCKTCKKEHHAYQNNGRCIFVVSPGALQDLEDILVTPATHHMDLISLGDAQVETMHHVISAELRLYPIPVDVIIVAPGMQDLRDGYAVYAIVAKLK